MKFEIRPAAKERAKLRLGIAGPAGSGKSYTALLIASGLGGRIGVIDTEHRSAHLYADLIPGGFDVIELTPPFAPDNYVAAIHAFEMAGVDTIIIDSLSHAWAGEGGALDMQGKIADKTGNTWAAWRTVTPKHTALIEAMLQSPCHIIATMRSKMDYVQEADGSKTGKVKKVGLAPVMRDGIEYEFTLFMEMDQSHNGFVGKDRTQLFDNQIIEKPDADMGRRLLDWLNQGVEPAPHQTLRPQQLAALSDGINNARTIDDLREAYRIAAALCDALHDEQAKRDFNRLTNMRKHELEEAALRSAEAMDDEAETAGAAAPAEEDEIDVTAGNGTAPTRAPRPNGRGGQGQRSGAA
ncbi:MAG TPA: ATP-binding protein [Paucimonas sp.]|nr:ATP-binding protein [Paucimonas sp.]